jgi:hypothetical protein
MESLFGTNVLNKKGEKINLTNKCAGKTICLYFTQFKGSDSDFDAILKELFINYHRRKYFEIISIYCDSFDDKDYYKQVPWFTLQSTKTGLRDSLIEEFCINRIPKIAFIDGTTGQSIPDNDYLPIQDEVIQLFKSRLVHLIVNKIRRL